MAKKLTFEAVLARFKKQGRTDIEICQVGFKGWKEKSKFYDKVQKEYFFSVPYRVWKERIVHPKRIAEKRKTTLLKRYGVEHQSQLEEVKEKISKAHLKNFANPDKAKEIKRRRKEGCISKYGVDNAAKVKSVREKIIKTNLKRYGAEAPAQSKKVQDKTKRTNIEKYGVDNPMKSKEIQDKLKQTVKEKYGVEYLISSPETKEKIKKSLQEKHGVNHPSQLKSVREKISRSHLKNFADKERDWEIKEKRKKTCLKRYGAVSPLAAKPIKEKIRKTMEKRYNHNTPAEFLVKYRMAETDKTVMSWLEEQDEPKPSKITLQRYCCQQNKLLFSEQELLSLIKSWKENQTVLEQFAEQLFETKRFNKKPKQIIKNYRPDFKLSPQIFLNVDGLYWHSEQQKDRWYHFNLRKEFEENNLRVFQFREDEIYYKPDIVKSIVDNALGKTKNKIFARKCKVEQVKQKEATDFLQKNHLMGSTNAKHLGLYFNNMLVSLLSYKQRKHVCKIERFCSLINTNVVGGFSKLLNYLENNYLKPEITEIHNWVDLRYGTGRHLKNKNFKQIKEILGWKWTDFNQTYNRLKCRANMDQRKLTQQEHSIEMGWSKIYDAGQRLWIKNL